MKIVYLGEFRFENDTIPDEGNISPCSPFAISESTKFHVAVKGSEMLVTILLAIFAAIWAETVNISCGAGAYTGNITVTLTYEGGEQSDGKQFLINYKSGDGEWSDSFNDSVACKSNMNDPQGYCNDSCGLDLSVATEVVVVIPTELVEPDKPEGPKKAKATDINLNIVNAKSLTIKSVEKDDLVDPGDPEKHWNVIKGITITQEQGFPEMDSMDNPTAYCGSSIDPDYPKGDCYHFDELSVTGVTFAASTTISSTRAIDTVKLTKIKFCGQLNFNINIYPGIYQGPYEESLSHEDYAVKNMTLSNVEGVKGKGSKATFTLEGNVSDTLTWTDVTTLDDGGFVFNVTKRKNRGQAAGGREILCPDRGTTHDECEEDKAIGYVNNHIISKVTLPKSSSISIDGWVKELKADSFMFNTGEGSSGDTWFIKGTSGFEGGLEPMPTFNVYHAMLDGVTNGGSGYGVILNSHIHYTIHHLEALATKFDGVIMSKSNQVDINGSVFNKYIRHVIGEYLNISQSEYTADTYYDHYDHSGVKYYRLTISEVGIGNVDFVVSADNDLYEEEDIILNDISCAQSWGDETELNQGSKVFLLRHMSNSVIMKKVQGCNLYFKNNANHNPGNLNLNKPESFTYKMENGDEEVGGNDHNSITVFDNADYHVVTNISIKNVGELGYVKFNRVDIDEQADGNSNTHLPEVDPLNRNGFGNSYPVNITLVGRNEGSLIHNLQISHKDDGPADPTGLADGFCTNGETDAASYSKERDITYKSLNHQNDDVNLEISGDYEIETMKVKGDSLVVKARRLLSDKVEFEGADTSSVRIKDSRFRSTDFGFHESLQLQIYHTIFDGKTKFEGGSGSDMEFRTVHFTNTYNTSKNFEQPDLVSIKSASGKIRLDHFKVNYGDIEVKSEYGDIEIVQAFSPESMHRVKLVNYFGNLDVTHPDKYYHDLNSVVDFEQESGNVAEFEYASTDVFAFQPSSSMQALTSTTDNITPYVRHGNTLVETYYGNIKWEYAKNLDVRSVSVLAANTKLSTEGFDNINAVSTIYATGLESLLDFDLANLDSSKVYFIAVRDHSGVDSDVTSKAELTLDGSTWTCKHTVDGEYDPFDACLGYLILPTFDITSASKPTDGPTLSFGSKYVYMKDCASSIVNSLTIKDATGLFVSNLIMDAMDVKMKHFKWTYFEWTRYDSDIAISNVVTNQLNISVDNAYLPDNLSAHIVLLGADFLGIGPSKVTIGGTSGNLGSSVSVNVLYPSKGEDLLKCGGASNSGSYEVCNGAGTYDFSQAIKIGTPKDSTISLDSTRGYDVKFSYGKMTRIVMNEDKTSSLLDIKAGDKIIVDNHPFATDVFKEQGTGKFVYGPEAVDPTTNNVYIIKTNQATPYAVVLIDTDADGMIYRKETFFDNDDFKTHKFNLIEQASLYLYIPTMDDISISTAGDNINLILGDVGVYGRIYTSSYLLANVLRAKTVDSVASIVYSLEASVAFRTYIGHVGINVDKVNSNVLLSGDTDKNAPVVLLDNGSVKDLGVYTRNYKTVNLCRDSGTCDEYVVPCRDEKCEFVNYIWEPTKKLFWAGKDYNKAKENKDTMGIMFFTEVSYFKGQCEGNGEVYENKIKCPNTPVYVQNIDHMSAVSIRGKPAITEDFEPVANKNNRYVDPTTLPEEPEEVPGMPGWAIGLIVLTCIITAILIVMFVLKFLGKDSLSSFQSSSDRTLSPN